MDVERVVFEVHRTRQDHVEPNRVQDIAIWVYSHQNIGLQVYHPFGVFRIGEEGVWLPDASIVHQIQVLDLFLILELESRVIPLLSEGDLTAQLHLLGAYIVDAADVDIGGDNCGDISASLILVVRSDARVVFGFVEQTVQYFIGFLSRIFALAAQS